MKKFVVLSALCLIFAGAGSALAAGEFTNSTAPTGVNGVLADYRTSANVSLFVVSAAANYNAISGHLQGNLAFGSSSGDAIIYRKDKSTGTPVSADDVPALGLTASDTESFAGNSDWSAM